MSSNYQEGKVYKCPTCKGTLEFSGYKDEAPQEQPQKVESDSQTEAPLQTWQASQDLNEFVIEQMKAGVDKLAIFKQLMEKGVYRDEARQMVDQAREQLVRSAEEEEKPTIHTIHAVLLGGLVASVVGGIVWGLIVITTNYEVGFMAWGIGLLTGFAVALFSRGRKVFSYKIIAVVSGVLGILIGKYITFYHLLKIELAKRGDEAASGVSFISTDVIYFFLKNMGQLINAYDFIWFILAIATAWKVSGGIKRVQQ